MVSMPQCLATAGTCAGYFTCYGSINLSSSISWRLPFILQTFFAIGLAVSCMYLPSSPRWLIHKGRQEEARRKIERLGLSREEFEHTISTSVETANEPPLSAWQELLRIFRRQYRMRTGLGLFILGMIQLSGIDGVLYVSEVKSQGR